MRQTTVGILALLASGMVTSAIAQEMNISGNSVSVSFPGDGYVTWEIAGPGGFHKIVAVEDNVATIDLGGKAADGLYKYEGTGASRERTLYENPHGLDDGRTAKPKEVSVGLYISGAFRVENGKIVTPGDDVTEEDQGN